MNVGLDGPPDCVFSEKLSCLLMMMGKVVVEGYKEFISDKGSTTLLV